MQMRHPEESKLLFLAEGELSPRQARALRIHLERCGVCRGKMSEFETGIQVFLEYSGAALLSGAGKAPNGWSAFAALLDQAAGERRIQGKAFHRASR